MIVRGITLKLEFVIHSICNNKTIYRPNIFKLYKEHENKLEAGHALQAIIFPLVQVLPSKYGFICNIKSSMGKNKKPYQVIIRDYPSCYCMDFVMMMASLLREQGNGCNVNRFITFYNMLWIISTNCVQPLANLI